MSRIYSNQMIQVDCFFCCVKQSGLTIFSVCRKSMLQFVQSSYTQTRIIQLTQISVVCADYMTRNNYNSVYLVYERKFSFQTARFGDVLCQLNNGNYQSRQVYKLIDASSWKLIQQLLRICMTSLSINIHWPKNISCAISFSYH